jgi:hypothetical protein
MEAGTQPLVIVFAGNERVASGELPEVMSALKALVDRGESRNLLVFDRWTGRVIDLPRDLPATATSIEVAPSRRSPGRPKLGVIGREVTLLPRHWEWLNVQPGGASVALRKLVDQARKANEGKDRVRLAQEATFRFMSAMAGDEVGFEEAARALFARSASGFEAHSGTWPTDVREHARVLATDAFADGV